jgi:NADH dehydrogenase FAD-containing subunit
LRASVIPGWEDKVLVSPKNLFPSSSPNLVLSNTTVASINEESIKLESQVTLDGNSTDTIPYAYLIFATGSVGHFPIRVPTYTNTSDAKKAFKDMQSQVKKATKILIVGGGPVGFEFAGEITEYYNGKDGRKKKEVTLVSSGNKLLHPDAKDNLHSKALNALKKSGVKVILGQQAKDFDPKFNGYLGKTETFTLQNGETVDADFVLSGIGAKGNSGLAVAAFGEDIVEQGSRQIKVRGTFQLENHDNIFAVGDVCNAKENKQAAWSARHAAIVGANIPALINNTPLKEYSPQSSLLMLASYGAAEGYGQLMGVVPFSWIGSRLKSRGLFAEQFAKSLNTTFA